MKRIGKQSLWWLLFALLLAPAAALAQDQKPEHGSVEFGYRHIWGDVYGRPDLPFKPDWETSRFNEYRDLKSGVFIRDFRGRFDDLFGSRFYVSLQSQKSFYDDQSYLATFGQYGKFKVQFRYEETPHIFSNTTRTLFTRVQPGVFTVNPALRATLQATSAANTPATSLDQVDTMAFITPRLKRKLSGLLFSYDPLRSGTSSFSSRAKSRSAFAPSRSSSTPLPVPARLADTAPRFPNRSTILPTSSK
jgi:hypothetical protein